MWFLSLLKLKQKFIAPVDLPKLNDLLVPWPKGPAVHRPRDNSNVPMASAQPKWKEIPGFKKGFLVGGWTNPIWKTCSNWNISKSRGEKKECLKPPPSFENWIKFMLFSWKSAAVQVTDGRLAVQLQITKSLFKKKKKEFNTQTRPSIEIVAIPPWNIKCHPWKLPRIHSITVFQKGPRSLMPLGRGWWHPMQSQALFPFPSRKNAQVGLGIIPLVCLVT